MINNGLFTSKTEERATPQDLFEKLNGRFWFTLDPCSTHENAKCKEHYTKEENGLIQDRSKTAGSIFINPPYWKTIGDRVKKAYEESLKHKNRIVMLLPARTDTKRFHNYIYNNDNATIHFIKWRLKFWNSKNSAPFPSMIVVYNTIIGSKTLQDLIENNDLRTNKIEN